MNSAMESFFARTQPEISALSEAIFHCAETAEQETESSQLLAEYLERHGFAVERGVGAMPTSLRAVRGKGRPVIGFLGEYDALAQLDQPPLPYYSGDPQKNGHACGHNLLGTASAAAAAAVAEALAQAALPGTVVYYGCPAEEILKGKVVMLKNGCFGELDTALSWHPGMENNCGELSYLAMDSVRFFFEGKASHASAAPYKGRSALDGCELMNVGTNYLREHVTDDVRVHYSYLPGAAAPNIVPARAGLWYFIRARRRDTVDDVTHRILDIARGAALMTSTQVRWEFLSRGYDTLVNFTLCNLISRAMKEVGPPAFSAQDRQFIRELAGQIDADPASVVMDETLTPPTGQITYMSGSTDISDVSQVVPTGYFRAACGPTGSALHSWQYAACAGHSVGRAGMLFAAKVLAETGWQLAVDAPLLDEVKAEFQRSSKPYRTLIE